jgi:hypothetical protein
VILDLFTTWPTREKHSFAAPEVVISNSDGQAIQVIKTRRTDQHHPQPLQVGALAPGLNTDSESRCQLRMPAVPLNVGQRPGGQVRLMRRGPGLTSGQCRDASSSHGAKSDHSRPNNSYVHVPTVVSGNDILGEAAEAAGSERSDLPPIELDGDG